jgi:cold shock CspA family protein
MRGTVLYFKEDLHWGRIQPEDGGQPIYVHITGLTDPGVIPRGGDLVQYEVETGERGPYATQVRPVEGTPSSDPTLARDCFVVMPYGRNPEEIRWFAGWYKLVIAEGVNDAGFLPILAAAQERPAAINDEIRSHLALDAMVVVDLGGISPHDEPNPNVMYELGIRHAFNLPHVIMAWEGQRLPFDISNQRVITERRDLIDVPKNRERLTKFIKEAEAGQYYRPMEAVGRSAA